ncbi:hypothetical protein [Antrihabitans sp. YC2-6]|uniref:hypothetical protein n=1 Tax=Antrihabitans sp. YC2-6 TaxID=2799498 RepID=UPI0018F66921|nr:hypothetical protein [Antrihabitans sp. YC2-6]MBJ8346099.1 hypothetical protein [Antrihabitans sp. YC2-6]
MRSRIIAVPLFALCVAVATGCSSDSSSDAKAEAPTKAEYITSADNICKELETQFDEDTKDLDPSNEADLADFKDAIVSGLREQLVKLRALTPPEGDAQTVDAIYDEVEAGADKIDNLSPDEIGQGDNPLEKADELATDYGMKECGSA